MTHRRPTLLNLIVYKILAGRIYYTFNFEMVLGVGLISAIVISKKNPNYKTRLQKLRLKLQKQKLTCITLYQIPTKRIIAILIIILILFSFNYFQHHYFHQIMADSPSIFKLQVPNRTINNQNGPGNDFEIAQINSNYEIMANTLMWIKIAYFCMIIGIIADLEWKVVTISSTHIIINKYNRTNYGKVNTIVWKNEYKVQITRKGQDKFNHNTLFFVIQLIDKNQKRVVEIIRRGHIFQARKTIIEMGSVLSFQPDLLVH